VLTCDIRVYCHAHNLCSFGLRSGIFYWLFVSSIVIGRPRPFLFFWIFCLPNFKPKRNTAACFRLCMLRKPWQDENCALLGYYSASSDNVLPKFRGILSAPSSGVKIQVVPKRL
jgi:hypothetical protein